MPQVSIHLFESSIIAYECMNSNIPPEMARGIKSA
jgi:hypothetical protein